MVAKWINENTYQGILALLWTLAAAAIMVLPEFRQPYDIWLCAACGFIAGRKYQRMLDE